MQYRLEFSLRIGEVFSELVLFCPQVVSLLWGAAVLLAGSPQPVGSSLAGELVGTRTGSDAGSRRLSEGAPLGGTSLQTPGLWPSASPRCSPKS